MRTMNSIRTLVAILALGAALSTGCNGCKKDEPKSTRWDDAAAATTATTAATATRLPTEAPNATPIAAGTFNKFFPKDGEGGRKRVFAADKEGFAEAKLQKDGKEVAVLSISDADKLPFAKSRFDSATEKLEGFPMVTLGNNQTSVLVKERFQVKVSSPTLDHEARKAILATFDLKGLNSL